MDPETYEWLYLGFMVLVVIYFHMESLTRFLEKACGGLLFFGLWEVFNFSHLLIKADNLLLNSEKRFLFPGLDHFAPVSHPYVC